MSKSTVTVGQTKSILQMLDAKNVPAAQLQAMLDKGLLADLVEGNLEKVARDDFRALLGLSSLSVITSRTPHNIWPFDDTLDLAGFYTSRPGLHVWGDFVSAILAPARISKKKPVLKKVYSRDLTADAQDDVIERGLGKNHYFEEKEVALLVAKMVVNQEGGFAGDLLSNGKANLFYTKGCVVCVLWLADDRRWHVNVDQRGGFGWNAGNRVFSRN